MASGTCITGVVFIVPQAGKVLAYHPISYEYTYDKHYLQPLGVSVVPVITFYADH